MRSVFNIIMGMLGSIARATGLTYNEVNIIVYYMLVPLMWTAMLDICIGKPICTILFVVVWTILLIANRRRFTNYCNRLFFASQRFLRSFGRIGLCSQFCCLLRDTPIDSDRSIVCALP